MPFCPECRSEYREGFRECADCKVPLVEKLSRPSPPVPIAWEEIFRGDCARSEAIRAALESAGLEAVSPDESLSVVLPYVSDGGACFRVLVHKEEAELARAIIQGLHQEERESSHGPDDGSS